MTEKELEKVADIIHARMMVKQKEYDEEFKKEMSMILDEQLEAKEIRDELMYLNHRLEYLLRKERYEDAEIIRRKIQFLESKTI